MTQQEFYRQEYRRLKPEWRDSLTIYCDLIAAYTSAETQILDVGCGHSDFLQSVYAHTPHTFGLDPDATALQKNTVIPNKLAGVVENLPFAANCFDLVVCAWVLEHLSDPCRAFAEIYRVLKPGGKVIFLTPNACNYNVWIIRLIPGRFHDFFTRKLYHRQEKDTYPVRYRLNSGRKIAHTLPPIGFKKIQLRYNGDPSYISFNAPTFRFARWLERILDFKLLRCARVHLIGVYEK